MTKILYVYPFPVLPPSGVPNCVRQICTSPQPLLLANLFPAVNILSFVVPVDMVESVIR